MNHGTNGPLTRREGGEAGLGLITGSVATESSPGLPFESQLSANQFITDSQQVTTCALPY